jgi:hypothetical protein
MFHVGIVCVVKGKFVPLRRVNAYETLEVYLHSFLALPLITVSGQLYATTLLRPHTH